MGVLTLPLRCRPYIAPSVHNQRTRTATASFAHASNHLPTCRISNQPISPGDTHHHRRKIHQSNAEMASVMDNRRSMIEPSSTGTYHTMAVSNRASTRLSTYSMTPTLAPSIAPSHLSTASETPSEKASPLAQDMRDLHSGLARLEQPRLVTQRYAMTVRWGDAWSARMLALRVLALRKCRRSRDMSTL